MVTIFSHMSALAQQYGAINLAQGFPDFPIDERLGELVHRAIADGHNQYAPMPGLPALREAIAADWQQRHGIKISAQEEITITPGATYGLFVAFQSILRPGDEVIILEPAYDSYVPAIRQCGAIPVPVRLEAPHFRPDFDTISVAITPKTRCIVVNTPHNPTGTIWTAQDWTQLEAVISGREDIIIISDEVYEQLVYDGVSHHSILGVPGLRSRAFAVYSFGKALHTTGWKMGYTVAPIALTTDFRMVHQYFAFSVNSPMQKALADYLALDRSGDLSAAALMLSKRNRLLGLLQGTPFRALSPASGSYFQLVSYAGISDKKELDFAEWLTATHGVATIPVSAFYSAGAEQQFLRLCFAKKPETLEAAARKLREVTAMTS